MVMGPSEPESILESILDPSTPIFDSAPSTPVTPERRSALPAGWSEARDAEGNAYYVDAEGNARKVVAG